MFLLFFCSLLEAAPKFSIVWSTETHTGASNFLKDENDEALDSGSALNGDGDLVEIGYFSEGTISDPFDGDWIPLTINTRVGDSSSGFGFPNGMFTFKTTFTKNSNSVTNFWGESKSFTENLSFEINASSPPPLTTPVCVRFYDSPSKLGAKYNTVTNLEWKWPNFPNGSNIPTTYYFKIAPGNAPAGSFWTHGNTFEDPASLFKTSIRPTYSIQVAKVENSPGRGDIGIGDINTTSVTKFFGEEITLKALPDTPHSEFMGWIGSGIAESWNQTTTLTVNGDQKVYAEFFTIPYLLNLDVNGEGSVSGSGSYTYEDVVPIYAYPSNGHSFVRWEKNENTFSTSAEVNVTIEGDTDLVAIFARNKYQVNVGSTEGGTYEILDNTGVTASSYSHGFTYALRAVPDPHYGFSSWYSTPAGLSMLDNQSSAQTTFIPTGDANYTALFSELLYKLNIESTQGYSSLSASGSFPALSMVPVQVKPANGFVFDYWLDPMGILLNQDSNVTEANMSLIYPSQEATISAILRLDDYTDKDINITSDFGGHISFESDLTGGFTHFNSYDLNATPILGYEFDQWIGDIEQLQHGKFSPSNKILIEGPLSLKATYKLTEYKLNLSSTEGGSTTGSESFTINSASSIQAFAFPGWEFSHWTGDIDFLLNSTSSETLIQIDSNSVPKDLNFTANFTPRINNFVLKTDGNGTVDISLSNGDNFYNSSDRILSIDSQTQIIMEAYPDHGWNFSGWFGLPDLADLYNPLAYIDPSSSVTYFYPSSDLNITANFDVKKYSNQEIIVNASSGGDVILMSEENGEFLHFSSYNLLATPHKGYFFSNWVVDSSKSSSLLNGINNAENILKVDGNVEINATFTLQTYELLLNNSDGGYTTGPSTYTIFESPNIRAIPLEGWKFSHWSGDTNYLSNPNAQETLVNHADLDLIDLNFTANFTRKIYEVSLNIEGLGSLDVFTNNNFVNNTSSKQSVSVDSATRIGLDAIPTNGWKFSKWFGLPNPEELIDPTPSLNTSSSSINFIPSSDVNLTVQFVRQDYRIQTLQAEFGGSVTSGGIFPFESEVEINASAHEHYNFYQWDGDIEHLVYPFTYPDNKIKVPDSNLSIQPIFKPKIYSASTTSNPNGYFEISGIYNDISYTNQIEFNATSSLTVKALPNNSDDHMLNYIEWNNTLGESGKIYTSSYLIPFLDSNYSFSANFAQRSEYGYSLTKNPPSGGTAGTDYDNSTAKFQRLIAEPYIGFSFLGWSSDNAISFSPHWTQREVTVELSEDDMVEAQFSPKTNFLSLQYDELQGSVSGFTSEMNYGTDLNLTALPNENYAFAGWNIVKEVDFNVTKNQSTLDPEFLRLYINSKESPELSLIRGFTYRFNCDLEDGDAFFLSTSPNAQETEATYYDGISGHLTSKGVLTFVVPTDAPSILYYHNAQNNYSGNLVRISTVADSSLLSNTSNPVLTQRVTQSFGLKANFERTRHSLSISSLGEGDVEYTPQDIYFWGDTINISADPKEHWSFSNWDGDVNFQDSLSTNTAFTISQNSEVRAIFNKVQYKVDVNSTPHDFGIVPAPDQTFTFNDRVTLTASPKEGRQFEEWVEIQNLSFLNDEDRFNETATLNVEGNAKIKAKFSKKPIKIDLEIVTLDSNNNILAGEIGSSITGLPTSVLHGDKVDLNVKTFEGYTLREWFDSEANQSLSSQNNISFTATSDRKLKVILRKIHYDLEISESEGGKGNILTSSPFYYKDEIEISAVPFEHWEFLRWSGTGAENLRDPSSSNTFLTIEKDTELKAQFSKKDYSFSVDIKPSGYGGISTIKNHYNFEDNVTIYATPRRGKLFEKWIIDENVTFSSNSNAYSNPATFTLRGNSKITAIFKSKVYSVSYQVIAVDENDTVQEGVFGGKVLGGTSFEDEDIAEFAVSLANGFRLKHWQIENGDPNFKPTERIYKHEMLNDLNLSAVVTNRKYKVELNVIPVVGGEATLNNEVISDHFSNSSYSYGDNIEIKAFPKPGYRFVEWATLGASLPQPNESEQSLSLGNNLNITAYFAPIGKVNLTLLSSPSIAASDLYGSGSFNYDPEHSIFTSPKDGYIFSHWDYNGSLAEGIVRDSYSPNTSVRLDGNIVLTAVFVEDTNLTDPNENSGQKYLLSVFSSNTSHGTTSGSGFFRGSREIKAFPREGYQFSHWEGGDPKDVNSSFTTINVFSETRVVAHFKSSNLVTKPEEPVEEIFQLIVSSENEDHGTTSGSGSFPNGLRTIQAFPNDGYQFSHWEGDIITNEYSSSTQINLTANLNIIAHFQKVGIFDDSEVLDDGWWANPWFGYFWKVGEDDWLFHEKLGWIFLKKKGDSSIWVWIQKMNGWFWTAKEHYPYLHSSSNQIWYFLNLNQSNYNKLILYNFQNSTWESW